MAETYIGSDLLTNGISIDYTKKSILFKPVETKTHPVLRFFMGVYIFSMTINLLCVGTLLIIFNFSQFSHDIATTSSSDWMQTFIFLFIMFIVPLITTAMYSLLFLNKKWREKYFPKVNFSISNILFRDKRTEEINPDAIIDNKYIIPFFNNIKLEYEASEDFAVFLQNIDIINHFKDKDDSWLAVFTFSQKPLTGTLKLNYM